MAHSPSKRWVDGVLVDRCIDTLTPTEVEEKMIEADKTTAENKAVTKASKKSARK